MKVKWVWFFLKIMNESATMLQSWARICFGILGCQISECRHFRTSNIWIQVLCIWNLVFFFSIIMNKNSTGGSKPMEWKAYVQICRIEPGIKWNWSQALKPSGKGQESPRELRWTLAKPPIIFLTIGHQNLLLSKGLV